ncbi:hypothetical protein SSX86_027797 [Deinandra increscens subsp. villosa]|uniref:Alpha/beta hydrolase fold-3 domain-containing protein n=1 Tax=Deinandra increscens subsp. villosa TaxID=3103831 RepID=A0AAP0C855_9ASTR
MDTKPATSSLPLFTRFKIFLARTILNASLEKDGTIDKRFLNLIDFKTAANSTPTDGVKSYDVSIDPCWFRVFVPDVTTDKLPVIVYYHGGGFALYGPDSTPFDGLCRRFASMIPAVVVSASFRLTPDHRYPSQYEDGINVLKFLDDEKNRKNLPEKADLQSFFVVGDSSGGNMAHHVCIRASHIKFKQLKVIGLVALQPFFGGEERTASELSKENERALTLKQTDYFWNMFKPLSALHDKQWDRDNKVINVSGPRAEDISGLDFPTTLVVVGGRDILQDWQRKYYKWLKKSGKEAFLEEYEYMFHAFYTFAELDESTHVISVVKNFVHKQMNIFPK